MDDPKIVELDARIEELKHVLEGFHQFRNPSLFQGLVVARIAELEKEREALFVK